MIKLLIICVMLASTKAGYASSGSAAAGSSSSTGLYNHISTQNAYADKYPYANTGYGGVGGGSGYTSNFVGAGATPFYGGFAPFAPVPQLPNPYDFSQFNHNFFQNLQSNFANSASQTYATPGATALASAALGPNNYNNNMYQQQLAHQAALFNNVAAQSAQSGGYGGYGQSGGFGNGGYAGSSASFGPQGFHQTAQIFPHNPASPNIDTRFGGNSPDISHSQGRPGYVGVQTSSFASSSDVNGVKTSNREAITSVNDNGKVTTYHVRS